MSPAKRHPKCLLLLGAVLVGACARFDADPDYQRARRVIDECTGMAAYDPGAEDAAAARVDELLADGLTVNEAVQVALLNNRAFQSLFLEIGASRADVAQAALLTNPVLSLGAQFPEGGGRTDITLGFAQQIADLWQIPIRKQVAEAELERTVFTVGQRALEIVAEVRLRCYRVLGLREGLKYLEEDARLAERTVELAEARLRAGEISAFEAEVARTGALDVQEEAILTRGLLRQAQADLSEVLGMATRSSEVELIDDLPAGGSALLPAETLLEHALETRFDLKVAALNIERAEAELRLQCRRFLPDVQLGSAFERGEQRALPERKILADTARASIAAGRLTAPTIQSRGQRNIEKSLIIDAKMGPTLALVLPIYDQNQAQVAKARTRVLQARKDYEARAEGIAAEIERAAAAIASGSELLGFQESHGLPAARNAAERARERYRAGEESMTLMLQVQGSLAARRRAHVNALREYAVGRAQLEASVGGQLPVAAPLSPKEQGEVE